MRVETIILSNLIMNEEYCRKTLPFLVKEYFHDETEATLFELTQKHIV